MINKNCQLYCIEKSTISLAKSRFVKLKNAKKIFSSEYMGIYEIQATSTVLEQEDSV